jgi:hypothetical protein
MTDRELMQVALHALEEITGWQSLAPGYVMEEADEAKNSLRERLARPEQEPVAWRYKINPPLWTYSPKYPNKELAGNAWDSWQVTPLYTAPPELVNWDAFDRFYGHKLKLEDKNT